MNKILHSKYISITAILISIAVYYLFAYHTPRTEFYQVLGMYTLLFIGFIYLYYSKLSNKQLVYLGIAFRSVLLFSIPNLSNDFYRFIWDGRAIFNGINPYLILPENNPFLLAEGQTLYKGMGAMNGSHYTCYPPINQLAFVIPALFASKNLFFSTVVMRLSLIVADIIALNYIIKLLQHLKLNTRKAFLYFLNPFIILELTGNLHYEGLMLAFLAIAIYFLFKNRMFLSAVLFALSVSVKLIPLIFIPIFFKYLGFKKTILYGSIVITLNALFFIPFFNMELYQNFMSSIDLYFQNFEFNASIYYIIREIGYKIKGYNIIHTVGKITPIVVIVITLSISFLRKNSNKKTILESMLFVIFSYYLLSSIVHPWYVITPLFLTIFTRYNFSLVWAYTVILSYSAYKTQNYHENLYLIFIEYIIVISYLMVELLKNSTKFPLFQNK